MCCKELNYNASYIEKSVKISFPGIGFYFKYQNESINTKKDFGSFFNEPCITVNISKKKGSNFVISSRITLEVKHYALNLYKKHTMDRTSF